MDIIDSRTSSSQPHIFPCNVPWLSKAPSVPKGPGLDADSGETALPRAAQGEFPGAEHCAGEAGDGLDRGPAAGVRAIPVRSLERFRRGGGEGDLQFPGDSVTKSIYGWLKILVSHGFPFFL